MGLRRIATSDLYVVTCNITTLIFQAVACSFIKPLAVSATTSIPSPSLALVLLCADRHAGAASCNRRRPTFVTAIRLARPRSPTWTSSIQPAESIRFTLRVRLSDPGDETARSPPGSPDRSWQLPVAARTAARRCRAEHIQRSRCISSWKERGVCAVGAAHVRMTGKSWSGKRRLCVAR